MRSGVESALPATLRARRLGAVISLVFLGSRFQNHVRFETVSAWIVIFRFDDRDSHDSGHCGVFTRTGGTLAGSSEYTLTHTHTISTDRLRSLARSHVRDIDDASIIRAVVATSSKNASDTVEDALACLERQSTNLGHGPASGREGGSLCTRFRDDLGLEVQMHANPALFSVLVVAQGDDLLYTTEGLNFFEVDPSGSQAFGDLDLVPVKDFELEVRRDARRLNNRSQNGSSRYPGVTLTTETENVSFQSG